MHTPKRKRFRLLLIGLVTPLLALLIAGPARADYIGTYNLKTYGNQACLDDSTSNPNLVRLWSCTGFANQHWYTTRTADGGYQFENISNNRCLMDYFGSAVTLSASSCDPASRPPGRRNSPAWPDFHGGRRA